MGLIAAAKAAQALRIADLEAEIALLEQPPIMPALLEKRRAQLAALRSGPIVGMGATYSIGGDSYPCTVVKVSPTGHRIEVAFDEVKGRGKLFVPGERQDERCETFTLREDGSYFLAGRRYGRLSLGFRSHDIDPHF